MAVDKITVSLPAELVRSIDELSAREGVSRSAIVREASTRYVTERGGVAAAALRREAADEALQALAELRRLTPIDDRPTLEILRELRGPLDSDDVPVGHDEC